MKEQGISDYRFSIVPVANFRKNNGDFDSEKQLKKIDEEYMELQKAYSYFVKYPSGKSRAHLAEEIGDLMTACATFYTGFLTPNEVRDVFQLIFYKNKIRGYYEDN